MNSSIILKRVGLCFILGCAGSACAELNPNTSGHIVSALEAKHDEFKACYEAALERNRETQGMVGLKLAIDDEAGRVMSAEVEESNIEDQELRRCVATAAEDIALPEPPGVIVEAHYDVEFGFE